jgi:hypothetical protein
MSRLRWSGSRRAQIEANEAYQKMLASRPGKGKRRPPTKPESNEKPPQTQEGEK